MAKNLVGLTISAAILIGAAGNTWAQDAQQETPADAEPVAETEQPAETEAETEAVPQTNAADAEFPITGTVAGPELSSEKFGDWDLRCTADESECFLYQLVVNPAGDPVSEISIIALPAGGEAVTGATVVTPLGTLLPAGLSFQIDSGPVQKFPFSWCLRSGCFSRFGLPAEGLASLKAGSKAIMSLSALDIPDQPIDLEVSLTGFTAGYNAMAAKLQ